MIDIVSAINNDIFANTLIRHINSLQFLFATRNRIFLLEESTELDDAGAETCYVKIGFLPNKDVDFVCGEYYQKLFEKWVEDMKSDPEAFAEITNDFGNTDTKQWYDCNVTIEGFSEIYISMLDDVYRREDGKCGISYSKLVSDGMSAEEIEKKAVSQDCPGLILKASSKKVDDIKKTFEMLSGYITNWLLLQPTYDLNPELFHRKCAGESLASIYNGNIPPYGESPDTMIDGDSSEHIASDNESNN